MPDAFSTILADWHLCGLAENREQWPLCVEYYKRVIDESNTLPLNIREWYRGTAGYGVARCASRMNDTVQTRWGLDYAASHHFWNFNVILRDSMIVQTAGTAYVDSLTRAWSKVIAIEETSWHRQAPIVYTPKNYDNSAKWPLLIAMHGGNGSYESFAWRWRKMADTLGAVVVVPAGIVRESEITNSWGADLDATANAIIAIANDLINRHLVDPKQVYLTGFSQGGQATIELSLRHPDVFRGGIAMSGFSSSELSDSVLNVAREKGVKLYAITGEFEDRTFRTQVGNVSARCEEAHVPFILSIERGMIHEVPLDMVTQFLEGWKWLKSNSAQQP